MNVKRTNSNNKEPLSTIKDLKKSQNSEIHIISAGPSAKNYDWKKLKGKDVMTINDVLFHLPVKTMYHVYNEPTDQQNFNYFRACRFIDVIKFSTFSVSGWHTIGLYEGENLAFQLAINVSIDLGYQKAYLYGYDFDCIDGYIHWWDEKPEPDNEKLSKKIDLVHKQKKIFLRFLPSVVKKIQISIVSDL
jgi:hypothetical protein